MIARLVLCIVIALATSTAAAAPTKKGYAKSGDLDLYYEVHGAGRPLVLLHGALCTIEVCFGELIPALAKQRQVIVIEQQGHGRTKLAAKHPFTVSQMAKDTAAVMKQLGISKADVAGYSMGAAVALELAITRPALVDKLVLISGAYAKDGVRAELHANMPKLTVDMMKQTPFYTAYKQVAPVDTFGGLVENVKTLDDSKTWPDKTIRALAMPVLLVVADADIIYLDHAVKFYRLLGGDVAGDLVGQPKSQLAIVPGSTHVTMMFMKSGLVAEMMTAFLAPKA